MKLIDYKEENAYEPILLTQDKGIFRVFAAFIKFYERNLASRAYYMYKALRSEHIC